MEAKLLHNGIELESINLQPGTEYIIGRDESCDLQLLDPKISRKHARIIENDQAQWSVELLSQSGTLLVNGQETTSSNLEHQDQIQVENYHLVIIDAQHIHDSETEDEDFSQNENFDENTNAEPVAQQAEQEFDDETTSGGNQIIENYLRVVYGENKEELLKIDGNHWVLGRSESSDIQLQDVKASRKHIVIRFDGKSYFAKDLGSSNGSGLNSEPMQANKEYKIVSGDEIQVGTTRIVFEQRNPMFDQQVARLPVQVHQHPIVQMQDGELNPLGNMPVLTKQANGEMGFVIPENFNANSQSKNKKLFYGVFAVLIGLVIYGASTSDDNTKQSTQQASVQKTPYQLLSGQQQSFVDSAYSSAHRFFSLEQWDLTISELEKIHRFLPKGYSNPDKPQILHSLEMKTIAESAAATIRDQEQLEQQRMQKAAFEEKIEQVISDCEARASSFSEAEARSCLEFVFINRPGNLRAEAVINSIKRKQDLEKQKRIMAQNRQRNIAKGEALYYKAERIDKSGDVLDAIDAYETHVRSSNQDPKNLKAKSRARIKFLRSNIANEIEKLRKKMQGHYENSEYKFAINTADKILKLDPSNADASDKRSLSQTKLNQSLRESYQDSIFREAHGEIQEAKKIWRRIITEDIVDGEYYKKATIKLGKHGDF